MTKTIFDEKITFNKNIAMNPYDSTLSGADGDNKRASNITFKGKDSDGSEGSLASIMACHSGIIKDNKGKIKFNVNDGSSSNNLLLSNIQHFTTYFKYARLLRCDTYSFICVSFWKKSR